MDSGTSRETTTEENKMTQLSDILISIKGKVDDLENLAKLYEQSERESKTHSGIFTEKANSVHNTTQKMIFDTLSLVASLDMATSNFKAYVEREFQSLWRFQSAILKIIDEEVDISHVMEQVDNKLEKLESKYDESHNAIIRHIEKVRQTNQWLQDTNNGEISP